MPKPVEQGVEDPHPQKVCLKATNKIRGPDLSNLSYHEQKEFFRLDQEYRKIFVEKHQYKLKKAPQQFEKALDNRLRLERYTMAKKFIKEEDNRNEEFLKHYCQSDNQIGILSKFDDSKVKQMQYAVTPKLDSSTYVVTML